MISNSRSTEPSTRKFDYKLLLSLGILITFMILFLYYEFSFGVMSKDGQFEMRKSYIGLMDLYCETGFNGDKYGYTGEILWQHQAFDVIQWSFVVELDAEQTQQLNKMLVSKLQSLPCYDEYVKKHLINDQKESV